MSEALLRIGLPVSRKHPVDLAPKAGRTLSKQPAARAVARPLPPSAQHAPSVGLPLTFILTGFLSLLVAVPWLAWRPDILATYHYNQYVLALTHLVNLGWVSSVIMGATYQLVPVALETKLHNERYGGYHYFVHAVGVVGMVWMFWVWDMKQVGHYGSLVALGMGLYVFNLAKTLRRVPRFDVVAFGTASSLVWLTLTMIAGLYVASAKCWDFSPFAPIAQMHAHAHVGVLGFFVMMIVTISYRLVPMFTLSDLQNPRRAKASIHLLNVGMLAVFITVLLGSSLKFAAALLVAAGLLLHAVEIRAILRARRRPVLDGSLRCFLTALILLQPLTLIGLVLAWPGLPATLLTTQLENVYGVLAILGVVTLAILGMLHKIVPFLVWSKAYSGRVGRQRVPALADLYSARLLTAGFWTYLGGLGSLCVAVILGSEPGVRWSCAVLGLALIPFAINLGLMLSHLVRTSHPGATSRNPASERSPRTGMAEGRTQKAESSLLLLILLVIVIPLPPGSGVHCAESCSVEFSP